MSPARAALASPWLRAVLLFALGYWFLDLALLRAGAPHPLDDLWEDGLISRALLIGRGFRTPMLYPPLWGLLDPTTLTLPVMIHGPILPLLWAPLLAAWGDRVLDQSAWLMAGFAVVTAWIVFRLSARHFGEPIGTAAAVLWTVSPLTLVAVHHYGSVVLGAMLLILTLDLLVRARPHALCAGFVFGISYLVRPEMLFGLPIVLALAGRAPGSRHPVWRALAGFVIASSWWWWHQARAVGSPWFNLSSYLAISFSPAHPGDALIRDFAATPGRWPSLVRDALPQLPPKWASFFLHATKNALTAPTGATGWLVPLGFAWALRDQAYRRLAIACLLLAAVPIAMMTLLVHIKHYLVPFLPLFCIGAALGLRGLIERMPGWAHRTRTWLGALLLLIAPTVGPALRESAREAAPGLDLLSRERARLAISSALRHPELSRRILFSDRPDFVAWTTGRPTLWLKRDEFERLYAGHNRPRGLPIRPDSLDTWFHEGHWAPGARLGIPGPRRPAGPVPSRR